MIGKQLDDMHRSVGHRQQSRPAARRSADFDRRVETKSQTRPRRTSAPTSTSELEPIDARDEATPARGCPRRFGFLRRRRGPRLRIRQHDRRARDLHPGRHASPSDRSDRLHERRAYLDQHHRHSGRDHSARTQAMDGPLHGRAPALATPSARSPRVAVRDRSRQGLRRRQDSHCRSRHRYQDLVRARGRVGGLLIDRDQWRQRRHAHCPPLMWWMLRGRARDVLVAAEPGFHGADHLVGRDPAAASRPRSRRRRPGGA